MSDDLIRENATLKAENTRRRHQAKELKDQLAKLETKYEQRITELTQSHEQALAEIETEQSEFIEQFTTLEAERDTLRGELDLAPEKFGKELEETRQQLTERDHRDVWRENIYGKPLDEKGEIRINEAVPIESLWRELGYKPEGKPDIAKARQLVLEAREAREGIPAKSYLFASGESPVNAPGGAKPASKVPPLPPGPGAARGGQVSPSAEGKIQVTRAQMRDPKFTTSKEFTAAVAAGKVAFTNE